MTADDARLEDAARRLLADSRFVARAVAAELGADAGEPQRLAHLTALAAAPWDAARQEGELQRRLAGAPPGPTALAVALRRLRRAVLLGTAVRDVAGLAPLSEVTGAMTALAQLAVQRGLVALAHEMAETFGVPMSAAGVPQDLLVVAMGKAGGGELNVSSDLDLVFVYDEAGQTQARAPFAGATRTLSNQEFFERLGRRLIALLSEPTADGFVFRVDMRLRPDGDAGPLAISNAMLEEYLIRQGREWERFAWLKGRVIAAPVFADEAQFAAQVRALQDIVRPFVFRKYLDYGAIAAQRELHARIRAETGKKSARRAGGHANHEDNIKLGRGGIREIEFVAQTFQIIRGGREPRLRERATLPTLATLAQLGLLPAATCEQLAAAYEFLRRLEHALQYVDDAQTHLLPADEAERARIARLLRLPDAQALLRQWEQTREFVAATFDAVFLAAPATGEAVQTQLEGEALVQRLAQLGYAEPATSAARVESLLASRRVAESERARSGIGALLAGVYEAVAQAARAAVPALSPDELLARLLRLLEVIARRSTYLALLAQYPRATAAVLRLLAASRWATDYLIRHPILLDELLDERLTRLTNETPVDFGPWRAELAQQLLAVGDDTERAMNVVRDAHHAQVFRLLVADLDGRLTVERLADHLSALADAVLDIVLAQAWQALPRRHREQPRFAVIAYGKLGGKELGYASDLDLIFLFEDEHPDAPEIYALYARRIVNWLTAQTASGILFDIDLRLRPNGNAGLLVSSRAAFERYQRNEDGQGAWTWEHQALTRARFCAGDPALGAAFEALRAEVLARPRDLARLREDVLQMRARMHEGHPNRTPLFDLKHDRGGMVDIEFIVQYLVLGYAHRHRELIANVGNIALLRMSGELGLIDLALAQRCADAYRTYRRLQHALRLNAEGEAQPARVPPTQVAQEAAAVRALWQAVFGADV